VSYSGDPSASDLDFVRFSIRDTSTSDELLEDNEINGLLTEHGSKYQAAAAAAEAVALGFAREADDITMGKLRIDRSKRADMYFTLAKRLKLDARRRVAPWAGGISKTDKETRRDDSDRVKPSFAIGMHETQPLDHGETQIATQDDV
jgi:hypothetical protein